MVFCVPEDKINKRGWKVTWYVVDLALERSG
jgi:hypothetical protein